MFSITSHVKRFFQWVVSEPNKPVDPQDLDCPICYNTMDKVKVLFCQGSHAFCTPCIDESLTRVGKKCPMCVRQVTTGVTSENAEKLLQLVALVNDTIPNHPQDCQDCNVLISAVDRLKDIETARLSKGNVLDRTVSFLDKHPATAVFASALPIAGSFLLGNPGQAGVMTAVGVISMRYLSRNYKMLKNLDAITYSLASGMVAGVAAYSRSTQAACESWKRMLEGWRERFLKHVTRLNDTCGKVRNEQALSQPKSITETPGNDFVFDVRSSALENAKKRYQELESLNKRSVTDKVLTNLKPICAPILDASKAVLSVGDISNLYRTSAPIAVKITPSPSYSSSVLCGELGSDFTISQGAAPVASIALAILAAKASKRSPLKRVMIVAASVAATIFALL